MAGRATIDEGYQPADAGDPAIADLAEEGRRWEHSHDQTRRVVAAASQPGGEQRASSAMLAGFPPAPPLTAGRVQLDPLRVEHAEEMAPLLDDPGLHSFIGGRPATPVELRHNYRRQSVGFSPDGSQRWLNWTVRRIDDGRPLGAVQATVTADADGLSAEVAWVIAAAHQRQGLATEAAKLMVAWLRHHGGARIVAYIHPDHLASNAVAGRIGLSPTASVLNGEVRWQEPAGHKTARGTAAAGHDIPVPADRPEDLPVDQQTAPAPGVDPGPHRRSGLGCGRRNAAPGLVSGSRRSCPDGPEPTARIYTGRGHQGDLVYFDPDDLTAESEQRIEQQVAARLRTFEIVVDVHDEARVHLWYEKRFGEHLDPYRSTEEAMSTWPTTASSVGIRRDSLGFVVCAPFRLSDLLAMVARPNKTRVSQQIYEEKVARWQAHWPKLRVIPW